jgi:hypothetical protein
MESRKRSGAISLIVVMGLKLEDQDDFANYERGNSGMFTRSGMEAVAGIRAGSSIV